MKGQATAIGAVIGIAAGLAGVIVGPVIGAVIGEWFARRNHAQAARAGIAAGPGFILAVAAKIGIAFTMLGLFTVAWIT